LGDEIKENVIGGACCTHARDKKFIQNYGWKTWREEILEDLGVDWKIILGR